MNLRIVTLVALLAFSVSACSESEISESKTLGTGTVDNLGSIDSSLSTSQEIEDDEVWADSKRVVVTLDTEVSKEKSVTILRIGETSPVQGCYSAEIKVDLKQSKALEMAILGYSHPKKFDDLVCTAEAAVGTVIPLDQEWLNASESRDVFIQVDGLGNQLQIKRTGFEVELLEMSVENVVASGETTLYPNDVLLMYVSGQVQEDVNYQKDLIDFARSEGYELAEEKYQRFPGTNTNKAIYVVADLQQHGELANHPGVEINLKRPR